MQYHLNLVDRIILRLTGRVYVGEELKQGWKNPLPFYVFNCPFHGLVKSYPQTHGGVLMCPRCIEAAALRSGTRRPGGLEAQTV